MEVKPNALRYYICGEYGRTKTENWRPHYHAILFGVPGCLRGRTNHKLVSSHGSCCGPCDLVRSAWSHKKKPKGDVELGPLDSATANYCAGYLCEKLTRPKDMEYAAKKYKEPRLASLKPEFSIMSLNPGIGSLGVKKVAKYLKKEMASWPLDAPSTLKYGGKAKPLGKYLRGKIRDYAGIDKEAASQKDTQAFRLKMFELYKKVFQSDAPSSTLAQIVDAEYGQRARSIEERYKLFRTARGKK